MKVGILTFHFAYNYGAVLQAWGLQQAIESLGHEVCFLNYVPDYMKKRVSPFLGWGLRSGSQMLDTLCHRLGEVKRRKRFSDFSLSHLNVSPKIKSRQDLSDFCDSLDAIVVGSDQVWNLNWLPEFDDTYFLGFLKRPNEIRKIAYGACFGHRQQPGSHLRKAAPLIGRFDHVGMRNEFGESLVEEVTGGPSVRVVDPAFFIPMGDGGKRHEDVSVYAVVNQGAEVCGRVATMVGERSGKRVVVISSAHNIRYDIDSVGLSQVLTFTRLF